MEQAKQELLSSNVPSRQLKQRINNLKQSQELALRELAAPAVAEVLAKALQMALSGDRRMIELILSLHISKPAAQEEDQGGAGRVQILVQNLTTKGGEMTVSGPKGPPEAVKIEATVLGDNYGETVSGTRHGHTEEHSEDDPPG